MSRTPHPVAHIANSCTTHIALNIDIRFSHFFSAPRHQGPLLDLVRNLEYVPVASDHCSVWFIKHVSETTVCTTPSVMQDQARRH